MAWNPTDDIIEVQRGPDPGGLGGAYRAFGETLRGLATTLGRLAEGPVTMEYPEEKTPVYPRFRGKHQLQRFEDTGLEKCVGCSLCAAACPADCIRVVAAENTPEHQASAGGRKGYALGPPPRAPPAPEGGGVRGQTAMLRGHKLPSPRAMPSALRPLPS